MMGQGHYVAGWAVVVIAHNWPVLLAGCVTLWSAVAAWRCPSRRRLALLYGAALLALAYEYHKHIGPQLQDAANYLLMFELLRFNRAVWFLVGPIATGALLVVALAFCAYALLHRRRSPSI